VKNWTQEWKINAKFDTW